jgi:hypothetical protein
LNNQSWFRIKYFGPFNNHVTRFGHQVAQIHRLFWVICTFLRCWIYTVQMQLDIIIWLICKKKVFTFTLLIRFLHFIYFFEWSLHCKIDLVQLIMLIFLIRLYRKSDIKALGGEIKAGNFNGLLNTVSK